MKRIVFFLFLAAPMQAQADALEDTANAFTKAELCPPFESEKEFAEMQKVASEHVNPFVQSAYANMIAALVEQSKEINTPEEIERFCSK